MQYLTYKTPELQFSLRLSDTVTAVYGDGNTGKTCIFNKLVEGVNTGEIADNLLFINMQMLYNVKLLKNPNSALIIIDDFDTVRLVHPEIVTYLNAQQNQVLLFGRDLQDVYIDKYFLYTSMQKGNEIIFKPVLDCPLIS